MYSCGPLQMDEQRQDDQLEPTYSSSVPIWDVDLKTCWKQWMIGRRGERESGISVLMAQHHDDDIVNQKESIVKGHKIREALMTEQSWFMGKWQLFSYLNNDNFHQKYKHSLKLPKMTVLLYIHLVVQKNLIDMREKKEYEDNSL